MRIGIDARMYRSSVAGIGRYSQNLIKNLLEIDPKDEFILFMTAEDEKEFRMHNYEFKNYEIVPVDIPHYSVAEQTKLPGIIKKEKCDLVHFLNFNFPLRYQGKFIVTVHDLTLFFYPETAKQTNFFKRLAFSYVFNKAIGGAQKVIAVSENTKKDIIKKFAAAKDKIEVIYEAADDKVFTDASQRDIEEIKSRYSISDQPVILYTGQMRPHKNIARLIEAFKILRKDLPAKLVLLGKSNQEIDKIAKIRDIVMPGFVSDKELSAWLKITNVFAFPSLYEGFGLPGLEAMKAGVPVASSSASCLPEIYKTAAIYFNPKDPSDIAEKIQKVLQDKQLANKLIIEGRKISNSFSWRKTAQETLKLYNQV